MKTRLLQAFDDSSVLVIPRSVSVALGWKTTDDLSIELPTTGGLLIYKESDPTKHYSGVKEVVHKACNCPTERWSARYGDHVRTCPSYVKEVVHGDSPNR